MNVIGANMNVIGANINMPIALGKLLGQLYNNIYNAFIEYNHVNIVGQTMAQLMNMLSDNNNYINEINNQKLTNIGSNRLFLFIIEIIQNNIFEINQTFNILINIINYNDDNNGIESQSIAVKFILAYYNAYSNAEYANIHILELFALIQESINNNIDSNNITRAQINRFRDIIINMQLNAQNTARSCIIFLYVDFQVIENLLSQDELRISMTSIIEMQTTINIALLEFMVQNGIDRSIATRAIFQYIKYEKQQESFIDAIEPILLIINRFIDLNIPNISIATIIANIRSVYKSIENQYNAEVKRINLMNAAAERNGAIDNPIPLINIY
jgi:hypothetical protein